MYENLSSSTHAGTKLSVNWVISVIQTVQESGVFVVKICW